MMSDFIQIYEHRKKREHRAFNALEVVMEWVSARFNRSHSIAAFKKIKRYGCRKKESLH